MEQTLIKSIELSNSLKLYFYDISRKLAGDRWYVGVNARIDIPLIDSLITNQHLSHFNIEEIRNALGESFRFQQKRERHLLLRPGCRILGPKKPGVPLHTGPWKLY